MTARALVTGAASGIGRATATLLAERGAAVACVDVNAAGLAETVDAIVATGGKAVPLTADVTDLAAVEAAVASAVAGWAGSTPSRTSPASATSRATSPRSRSTSGRGCSPST